VDLRQGTRILELSVMRIIRNDLTFACDRSFDRLGRAWEGVLPFEENSKWGLVTVDGSVVAEPLFLRVTPSHNGLVSAEIAVGQYRLIEWAERRVVRECVSDRFPGWLTDNLLLVGMGGLYGVIDVSGRAVIECKYLQIALGQSLNCLTVQSTDSRFSLIDFAGRPVMERTYEWMGKESSGVVPVRNDGGGMKLIDVTGENLSEEYFRIDDGECERFLFRRRYDEPVGFLDASGSIVIPPSFDDAGKFDNCRCVVAAGASRHLIEKDGRIVADVSKVSAFGFTDSLLGEGPFAARIGRKWTYADRDGRLIEPTRRFSWATAFFSGVAAVAE
jgi:hypothetical protein